MRIGFRGTAKRNGCPFLACRIPEKPASRWKYFLPLDKIVKSDKVIHEIEKNSEKYLKRERSGMKKKLLGLFLVTTLSFSVTACGNDSKTATVDLATETEAEQPTKEDIKDYAAEKKEEAETKEQEDEAKEAEADAKEAEADAKEADAEAEQVDDPIVVALENMNGVTSMEAQMVMNMDLVVEANGEKQSVESVSTMEMACFTDPMKIKMEMVMNASGETINMSVYADSDEDGNFIMYMYDGATWQSMPVDMGDLEAYDAQSSMVSTIGDTSDYVLEGTEQIDGANAYKYSNVMKGDDMKEALMSSGALDSLSSIGLTSSDVYGMLDGLGEIVTYVWVDEATLYPVKYEMDMTDVMDALMGAVVEAMGEQAEGMSMSIPKMEMTMTCSNFNNVADFTIPEEAKTATAVAPTAQ